MITWIIIATLILIALVFLRIEHHGRRIKLILIILAIFFLYISLSSFLSSDKTDFSSPKGITGTIYTYFGWLGKTAASIWDIGVDSVKTIGNAIKFNQTEIDDGRS